MIIFQISLIFFGYLRPSIIYDYLDYWPLTIVPLGLLFLARKISISEKIEFYSYGFLISVFIFFQIAHFFNAGFLTTYSFDSTFENLNLDSSIKICCSIVESKFKFSKVESKEYVAKNPALKKCAA